MQADERKEVIQQRLQKAFSPDRLEVIDDSARHKGHEGSKDGAGHYKVIIQAQGLQGKSRIDAHREIYALLADLIPHEIHALQIQIEKN